MRLPFVPALLLCSFNCCNYFLSCRRVLSFCARPPAMVVQLLQLLAIALCDRPLPVVVQLLRRRALALGARLPAVVDKLLHFLCKMAWCALSLNLPSRVGRSTTATNVSAAVVRLRFVTAHPLCYFNYCNRCVSCRCALALSARPPAVVIQLLPIRSYFLSCLRVAVLCARSRAVVFQLMPISTYCLSWRHVVVIFSRPPAVVFQLLKLLSKLASCGCPLCTPSPCGRSTTASTVKFSRRVAVLCALYCSAVVWVSFVPAFPLWPFNYCNYCLSCRRVPVLCARTSSDVMWLSFVPTLPLLFLEYCNYCLSCCCALTLCVRPAAVAVKELPLQILSTLPSCACTLCQLLRCGHVTTAADDPHVLYKLSSCCCTLCPPCFCITPSIYFPATYLRYRRDRRSLL